MTPSEALAALASAVSACLEAGLLVEFTVSSAVSPTSSKSSGAARQRRWRERLAASRGDALGVSGRLAVTSRETPSLARSGSGSSPSLDRNLAENREERDSGIRISRSDTVREGGPGVSEASRRDASRDVTRDAVSETRDSRDVTDLDDEIPMPLDLLGRAA